MIGLFVGRRNDSIGPASSMRCQPIEGRHDPKRPVSDPTSRPAWVKDRSPDEGLAIRLGHGEGTKRRCRRKAREHMHKHVASVCVPDYPSQITGDGNIDSLSGQPMLKVT